MKDHGERRVETAKIIPALPGYFALYWNADNVSPTPEEIFKVPIMAWLVHASRRAGGTSWEFWTQPVMDDDDYSEGDKCILRPDGTIYIPAMRTWGSIEEFLGDADYWADRREEYRRVQVEEKIRRDAAKGAREKAAKEKAARDADADEDEDVLPPLTPSQRKLQDLGVWDE